MRGLSAEIGQCRNATTVVACGVLRVIVCVVMSVVACGIMSVVTATDLHVRVQAALADHGASPSAFDQGVPRPSGSPRRIVSLVPSTTEMLFVMGAGARVVGVSSFDRYPAEVDRIPRLGGLLDPNVERVLSLKPDLAIVYDTQTEFRQQLARAGIPIFPYAHRGLPDITETMRALGARVGL